MKHNLNNFTLPINSLSEIKQLIPHRAPIIMVYGLLDFAEGNAETTLTIEPENLFVENGFFNEMGLIEHMAQSVALYTGFKNKDNLTSAKEGFIAGVKQFKLEQLPLVNQTLITKVLIIYETEQMVLVNFETYVDETLIASAQMSTILKD